MKTNSILLQEDQKLLPRPRGGRQTKLISRWQDRTNLRVVKDEEEQEQEKQSSTVPAKRDVNPFANWVMPPQQKGYIKGDDRNLLL